MRVSLRQTTGCLLLIVSVALVVVLDPTSVPPKQIWAQELAQLQRRLALMPSDLEKTTFLREYVGGLIDVGRLDDGTKAFYRSVNFESYDPAQFYIRFRSHSLAAECGATTFFYMKLLEAFGFNAYQYSFGFTDQPYAHVVHSVVLVEIAFKGEPRLIVQDPYLDLTYRDSAGEPIDFFEFLAALRDHHFGRILMDASSVTTSLLVPDPAMYYPYLNDTCRQQLITALQRGDGPLKTRIPLERSYATLMQSPCGSFETVFVEAMRAHGMQEPFLYSYTRRVSDLVGSSNHAEVQARIDACLRNEPQPLIQVGVQAK